MPLTFARVRVLLMDVPRHGKLAYCLLRDDRVPAAPKAALIGALGLIASPIDFPAWIPVVGELDMLALGILAVKVFVDACPNSLVGEHEEALKRGESIFDQDVQGAFAAVRTGLATALGGLTIRAGRRPRIVEDETA